MLPIPTNPQKSQAAAEVYLVLLESPELPNTPENRSNLFQGETLRETSQRIITCSKSQLEEFSKQVDSFKRSYEITSTFTNISAFCGGSVTIVSIVAILIIMVLKTSLIAALIGLGCGAVCFGIAAILANISQRYCDKYDEFRKQNQVFLNKFLNPNRYIGTDRVNNMNIDLLVIGQSIKILNAMQKPQFINYISESNKSLDFQKQLDGNAEKKKANLWGLLKLYQEKYDEENEIAKQHATQAASTMATVELSTNPGKITEDFSKRFLIPTLTDYLLPEPSQEGEKVTL